MSSKRRRTDEEEACEALGGLLRQTAARAVERVRLQRQQRSGNSGGGGGVGVAALSSAAADAVVRTAKPMDVLVIRFCMHYLDCSQVAGPTQFVRLAQEVVTTSVERVLVPQLFSKGSSSLPMLCESLVAEHTADEVQTAVKEINEFVEARGALGTWLNEAAEMLGRGDSDLDDTEDFENDWDKMYTHSEHARDAVKNEEDENVGETTAGSRADPSPRGGDFALASTLYKACEFWVRVQAFLNALSLHSARLHVFKMPPRYERELLLVLYNATRGDSSGASREQLRAAASNAAAGQGTPALISTTDKAKVEGSDLVKKEPDAGPDDAAGGDDEAWYGGASDRVDDDPTASASSPVAAPQQLYKASALLADVLALSRCPDAPAVPPSSSSSSITTVASSAAAPSRLTAEAHQHLKGINPQFYKMVYARLGVMVARDRLHRFDQSSAVSPPALTVQQRNIAEQLEQQQRQQMAAAAAALQVAGQTEAGLPTSYVPDDAYFDKLLQQQHDTVEEDEEVYKGEVMDYYLTHPGRYASGASASFTRSRQQGGARSNAKDGGNGEPELVKPHRFCKVKTGFSWTQYNRTHYDSRTNPPPRTEMWYEFTLFYPALANTKRDMRKIFRIEDAPEGPNDQYCLLVFSVGPPYADVAYRIRKKQWDTRPGGVRISFDQTGRYKLFFRFTNSNYRR